MSLSHLEIEAGNIELRFAPVERIHYMATSILYQNAEQIITVIDIPRSIELAQGNNHGKLLSTAPLQKPYPSVEPKSAKAIANLAPISISDLLLQRHLHLALEETGATVKTWYLPRNFVDEKGKRRSSFETLEDRGPSKKSSCLTSVSDDSKTGVNGVVNHGVEAESERDGGRALIPPNCTHIEGNIEDTCRFFTEQAPQFNLVIMDPPWPNRSVRRKQSYSTPDRTQDVAGLLFSLPIQDHLADDAFVCVWVTNKPAFRELLLGSGGFFDQWGLELSEEWIWLKVTASGEPICALDSTWRKPYEILLIGRKIRKNEVKRRVIIAVPDLHSRKPNLKELLQPMLPKKYEAIEIFARNLTAGWWAWGNEVLKFQTAEHWNNTL